MNSRRLVQKTLTFDKPETERIPRHKGILPWAEENYPDFVQRLHDVFPDDVVSAPAVYTKPLRSKGDKHQKGTYIDEWGCIFTNPLDERLDDLVLMLWPNNDQYAASMVAGPAVLQDELVEGTPISGSPGLHFDLPRSLGPGETIDFSLPFWLEIGMMSALSPKRMASPAMSCWCPPSTRLSHA